MVNNNRNVYHPLPYTIIEKASIGDNLAMRVVLSTYKNYISSLCFRTVYGEDGGATVGVDEFMYRRLATKLIEKVTKFDLNH